MGEPMLSVCVCVFFCMFLYFVSSCVNVGGKKCAWGKRSYFLVVIFGERCSRFKSKPVLFLLLFDSSYLCLCEMCCYFGVVEEAQWICFSGQYRVIGLCCGVFYG